MAVCKQLHRCFSALNNQNFYCRLFSPVTSYLSSDLPSLRAPPSTSIFQYGKSSDQSNFGVHGICFDTKIGFSTTPARLDLTEFFDKKENFKLSKVRVGRSWKLEELRIKSNSDLHKLWFILLKERNMLLTMEHEYQDKFEPMPSPERIHKVKESMKNLEEVVKERNRAYYMLETGESGERQVIDDFNGFGLPFRRKLKEHYIDKKYNKQYHKDKILKHRMVVDPDVVDFLKKYNEKQNRINLWHKTKRYEHVCGLFRRFSDLDEEAVRAEFPDVDIEKAKQDPRSRGPRVNMY